MPTKMKTVNVCGFRYNEGNPQNWWVNTGIFVNEGDQIVIDATDPGGVIMPWGGHAGFGPTGDEELSDWEYALAIITGIDDDLDDETGYENLWFGSLIGKIGRDGGAFYIGNSRTLTANRTGTLFLAFNDGYNFEDNSGSWNVDVTFEEHVRLASSGYGSESIYADHIDTSLLEDWGVVLTIQTDVGNPELTAWDSTAIANLVAAFDAVDGRL
jgi:hypothetical protein